MGKLAPRVSMSLTARLMKGVRPQNETSISIPGRRATWAFSFSLVVVLVLLACVHCWVRSVG